MWVVLLFVLQYSIKCREVLREKLLPITTASSQQLLHSNTWRKVYTSISSGWTLPFPQDEKDGRGSSDSDFFLAISLLSSGMAADAKSPLSVFLEQ